MVCVVDSHARGGVAVEDHARLETAVLLIARYIRQLRLPLEPGDHLRRNPVEFSGVGILESVLKLRAADAVLHRKVLDGLHVEDDSGHFGERGLQTPDHCAGVKFSLVHRLEIDENPSAVERRVGAVDSDE